VTAEIPPSRPVEPAAPAGDGGLNRVRLDLAYDGTDFCGWARQPSLRSVCGVVQDALALVLRLPTVPTLTVAGRTDAGVHAAGQVAHADLPEPIDPGTLLRRLRAVLPADVVMRAVTVVGSDFDARFAALARHYDYRITDGPADPLRRRDTLAWPRALDVAAMEDAARGLLGEHDFAAFCRHREGATTVRTLHSLAATRDGAGVVHVRAVADAFCHNQVRSMVGALVAVGEGRRSTSWPAEVLQSGERDPGVQVLPPHGLTLVAVDYPPDGELAERVRHTRRRRDALPDQDGPDQDGQGRAGQGRENPVSAPFVGRDT
jgi:tRNA pseudouridine38-40 synthase